MVVSSKWQARGGSGVFDGFGVVVLDLVRVLSDGLMSLEWFGVVLMVCISI